MRMRLRAFASAFEALAKAKILALDVIGDRLAHGEDPLTGRQLGETCPAFDSAASFGGIEFSHVAVVLPIPARIDQRPHAGGRPWLRAARRTSGA